MLTGGTAVLHMTLIVCARPDQPDDGSQNVATESLTASYVTLARKACLLMLFVISPRLERIIHTGSPEPPPP